MKIALLGTRGIPANYGGFETCVEEISTRLVLRGHEVTVYCRSGYYDKKLENYKGVNLIYLPNLNLKAFDTISHTFFSVCHCMLRKYDIHMIFNAANSPAVIPLKIVGKKIAINTDGLEWKRGKWGKTAQKYYKISEHISTKLTEYIVADSIGIQEYYKNEYNVGSYFIAYGAYEQNSTNLNLLEKINVLPNEYFLQITRFEPENNPLLTIEAYKKLKTSKKLVLVGGAKYETEYLKAIYSYKNDTNIIFPGFIYDKNLLKELWCNSFAYIHGNEVGGTNPALLQTMGSNSFIIARDVIFNREVLGKDGGVFYGKNADDLAGKMQYLIENAHKLTFMKRNSIDRLKKFYNWDRITEKYERMFYDMLKNKIDFIYDY